MIAEDQTPKPPIGYHTEAKGKNKSKKVNRKKIK
jgi:hypothetical protein